MITAVKVHWGRLLQLQFPQLSSSHSALMPLDAEILTFDPEGDIILLLEVPCRGDDVLQNNFGAGVECDHVYTAVSNGAPTDPSHNLPLEEDLPNDNWVGHVPQDDVPQDDVPRDDVPQDDVPQDDVLQDDVPQDDLDTVTPCAHVNERPSRLGNIRSPKERVTRTMKMRVSSRHLALASPVFGQMISTGQRGNHTHRSEEVVALEGDDFQTLQVLLNIVHGKHNGRDYWDGEIVEGCKPKLYKTTAQPHFSLIKKRRQGLDKTSDYHTRFEVSYKLLWEGKSHVVGNGKWV